MRKKSHNAILSHYRIAFRIRMENAKVLIDIFFSHSDVWIYYVCYWHSLECQGKLYKKLFFLHKLSKLNMFLTPTFAKNFLEKLD